MTAQPINTTKKDRPDYTRPEVVEAQDDLNLINDILAGTRRMHEMASTRGYIRQWKDEDPAVYAIRSRIEQVYEGLGRTLSAATGMIFQAPPKVTFRAKEAELAADLTNIDGTGKAFHVAAKSFTEAAIRDGYALVLVDHPVKPKDQVVTKENEAALGLRPTWTFYDRESVVNWRTEVINNRETLTLLVLRESREAPAGVFGIECATCYRELRLTPTGATWTLWREPTAAGGKFTKDKEGSFVDGKGKAFMRIPVAIAYAGRTDAPLTAVPPLRGVAFANLGHWQQATNLRFYREVASFPQPTVSGELAKDGKSGNSPKLKVGPMVVVKLGQGATFTYTELEGMSLDQVEKGVLKKEQEIAALGLSFLARDKRAQETAEAKRLDATAENSTLATSSQGVEDALNLALELHAAYRGIAAVESPVVALNRTFDRVTLGAAELTAVATLVNAGMPVRQAVQVLHAGGVIVVNKDSDLDMIALEWESGRAAAEAEKLLREQEEQDAPGSKKPTPPAE